MVSCSYGTWQELADHLTEIVVDAVQCIRRPGILFLNELTYDCFSFKLHILILALFIGDENEFDLHMVEIMHMRHQSALDTRFINGIFEILFSHNMITQITLKGIVMDHGTRHPNMAKRSENCHIFVLNVRYSWLR